MKIYAKNDYIIGIPYKFNEQHNDLIITCRESDNVLQIVSADSYPSMYREDDIIVYNKEKAIECTINGETYIAIRYDGVIAKIDTKGNT